MLSKIILITLLFCHNLSALDRNHRQLTGVESHNNSSDFNYFQILPNEIKQHIASFLEREEDEKLLRRLNTKLLGTRLNSLETTDYTITIDPVNQRIGPLTCPGNLWFFDKIKKKSHKLTDINNFFFNWLNQGKTQEITKFAVSSSKKNIVAVQSVYNPGLNSEIRHQKIWLFAILKYAIIPQSKQFPILFDHRTQSTISDKRRSELSDQGYVYKGYTLWTRLFSNIAVSNNGLIALSDIDTVSVLNFETEECTPLRTFSAYKGCNSVIQALEFDNKGAKIAVQYLDVTDRTIKNIIIPSKPELFNNFYSYFEKRGICKAKQLEQQP